MNGLKERKKVKMPDPVKIFLKIKHNYKDDSSFLCLREAQ